MLPASSTIILRAMTYAIDPRRYDCDFTHAAALCAAYAGRPAEMLA
jgi:hypothetical protein